MKLTISLNEKAEKKAKLLKQKLSKREINRSKLGEFLNELLADVSEKKLDQFVENMTSLEWKIAELLKDSEGRKLLEKATRNKSINAKQLTNSETNEQV